MTRRPPDLAARLRGAATGLLTGALAVAAHGAAGGVVPSGAPAALLCLLAASLGAVAGTARRASELPVLLGLLAAGQVIGHVMLAAAGHTHGGSPHTAPAMLAAHAIALTAGAVLIAGSERLCRALSCALRSCTRTGLTLPAAAAATPVLSADQPLHSTLLVAVSISHRGPPASALR